MLLEAMPQIVLDYSNHHGSHSYPLEGIAISSVCDAVNLHIHPAHNASHRCNRKEHYSSQCLSKTVFAASQEDVAFQKDSIISEEPVANHYLGTSQESRSVKLHVNSLEVILKIYTGAKVTAISEKVYQDLQWPTLQKLSGQHPLPVVWQF